MLTYRLRSNDLGLYWYKQHPQLSMKITFEDAFRLVTDPNTPPHILDELSTTEVYSVYANHIIRYHISMNPNTLVTTLEKLLRDETYINYDGIALNPNAPAYILDKLVEVGVYSTLLLVARNNNTSPTTLEKIAERDDCSYYIFNLIIKHPNVTETLKNYLTAQCYFHFHVVKL